METPTYKGQIVVECTKPQLFNPPRKMVVWDDTPSRREPRVREVCAIVTDEYGKTQASARPGANTYRCGGVCIWDHCGTFEEISEESKTAPKRHTLEITSGAEDLFDFFRSKAGHPEVNGWSVRTIQNGSGLITYFICDYRSKTTDDAFSVYLRYSADGSYAYVETIISPIGLSTTEYNSRIFKFANEVIKKFAITHRLTYKYSGDPGTATHTEPEETKPADDRRATYRELAMWLAKGNGEYKIIGYLGAGTKHEYMEEHGNKPLTHDYRVRKWTETEWHEPTIAYMGL